MNLSELFDRTIKGAKDDKFDIAIKQHMFDDNRITVKRGSYTYDGKSLEVKAYYGQRVVDCDRWTLRVFDARVENPVIEYAEDGYMSGWGFLSSLSFFGDGEEPEIEWNDDEEDEIKGWVDSCFPPDKIKSRNGFAVKVYFTISLRRN